MTVQITSDYSGTAQQLVLRSGQVARIGRSAWVELSIVDDASLEEQHFAIDYSQGPVLTTLDGAIVHRNGTPTCESALEDGDLLLAGQTKFRITIPNEVKTHASTAAPIAQLAAQPKRNDTWRNFDLDGLQIDQTLQCNIRACDSPQAAILMLADSQLYLPCIRFIAGILGSSDCVKWTLTCTCDPKPHEQGHAEINLWLAESTEENRRKVAAQLPSDVSSPADWLTQAVVWTGGSLGPAEFEPIPPPAHLPPLACSIAIQIFVAESRSRTFPQCIKLATEMIDRSYPNPSDQPAD